LLPGPDSLREETQRLIDSISFKAKPRFTNTREFSIFQAILSVGTEARPELPWTVINSNGWLARISSGGTQLSSQCNQTNPIGALGAASLGVTEVFKRLVNLKPDRGELADGLTFSFFSYQAGHENQGPELPETIALELMLVGVGAIGNAVVHLLNSLPLNGNVWLVDRQEFGKENLGTCILIGPDDLNKGKAEFAKNLLTSSRLNARSVPLPVETLRYSLGTEVPHPRLVVNALDNIDARHEVQQMWPDMIVDGAIGDFGCEVSLHPWSGDLSCLLCDFQHQDQSAETVQTEQTGLDKTRLTQPQSPVTLKDVNAARPEKREWLRQRIGNPICSVVSEAVLEMISQDKQEDGFAPSSPFVACLSGSMVVAELVRYILGWEPVLQTGYQFDVLFGPQLGLKKRHTRKTNCRCVERRSNINKARTMWGFSSKTKEQ